MTVGLAVRETERAISRDVLPMGSETQQLAIEAGLAIERNVLAEKLSWLEQTMSAISGENKDS